MNREAERRFAAEMQRHVRELAAIIAKWPESRVEIAYEVLGGAVGVCDSFGIDVQAWLNGLRANVPKPAVMVPPKEHTS